MGRPAILARCFLTPAPRRPRRRLDPAVRTLEGRQLLTGGAPASATMTQTLTFPDLESNPDVSDHALLYFSATMGTLTEVDVTTSGSLRTQLSAENLAGSARTIAGTTAADLSVNLPSGAIPVNVPAVTQSFHASAYDGKLDDGGTSGQTLAPATSESGPRTTVLTSPAALAAFTGHFRIPISVSGHATGSASPNDSNVSAAFNTETSATITVTYHYIPGLGGASDPGGPSQPSSGTPSAGPAGTASNDVMGLTTVPGSGQDSSAQQGVSSSIHTRHRHGHMKARDALHRPAPTLHRAHATRTNGSHSHPGALARIRHFS